MPASPELLQSAIQAAQSGQRGLARSLFLQVVEQDPYQAEAWIYLSRLVDAPEDQLVALENALTLQPGDPDLAARRAALLLAYPHLDEAGPGAAPPPAAENSLLMAQHLANAGRLIEAVRQIEEILAANPQDERAWQALSEIHPDPAQKIKALERVLDLNPHNPEAQRRLEMLRHVQQDPLRHGMHLEERGEDAQAILVYQALAAHSSSPIERLEAQNRIERIHLKREAQDLQAIHPNLNIARLSLGPVLLFLLMLFMQSGLNPLHLPLVVLPGIASVAVGSLLVVVTGMRPAPEIWVKHFGPPGTGDEPEMRKGLRLLGLALLLAPYTLFLIEAGHRLGVLQASMFPGIR